MGLILKNVSKTFAGKKVVDNISKEICNAIKFLDLDRMTPIQALTLLYDLQKKTKKGKK